jgi:hypothetical protein
LSFFAITTQYSTKIKIKITLTRQQNNEVVVMTKKLRPLTNQGLNHILTKKIKTTSVNHSKNQAQENKRWEFVKGERGILYLH